MDTGGEDEGSEVCETSRGGRFGSSSPQISKYSGREGGGSVPGHSLGTFRPAVRKKRVGEAKASNVLAGFVNSFSLSLCKEFSSHSIPEMSFDRVVSGGSDVPIPLQSKTPFFTISPAIRTGSCFDANDSVSASEVASVPPR